MRVSYAAIVLLGLGTLSAPARATPVEFAFTATVVGLGDHNGALAAAGITVGAAAKGVFGWDTDTADSDPSDASGSYSYPAGPGAATLSVLIGATSWTRDSSRVALLDVENEVAGAAGITVPPFRQPLDGVILDLGTVPNGVAGTLATTAQLALQSTDLSTFSNALAPSVLDLADFDYRHHIVVGEMPAAVGDPAYFVLLGIDSLQAIPEPHTMSLVGVGIAALTTFVRSRRA